MKVLFAVSNESISEAIIKRYPKEFKEILSYKNVYYFNAILKEIQKDKTYDRIVISEDLEPFVNTNAESIDNFIFEHLDRISDEANDEKETSIILICSERRTKGSSILNKLFSIGIYDALLGGDRNIGEVCKLINKPRTKKEAKIYYRIDQGLYEPTVENVVSEVEIQNILNYFKRLGKSTDRYTDAFNNIVSQYTDEQLKIIINTLPPKVKEVLAVESPAYQSLMGTTSNTKTAPVQPIVKEPGIKVNTIGKSANVQGKIVIPSNMKKTGTVVQSRVNEDFGIKHVQAASSNVVKVQRNENGNVQPTNNANTVLNNVQTINNGVDASQSLISNVENILENNNEDSAEEKRGRGRPRKYIVNPDKPKGKRGRPRKNVDSVDQEDIEAPDNDMSTLLADINSTQPEIKVEEEEYTEAVEVPGLDELDDMFDNDGIVDDSENVLPEIEDDGDMLPGMSGLDDTLPGMEDDEDILPGMNGDNELFEMDNSSNIFNMENATTNNTVVESIKPQVNYSMSNLNSLLTRDKKIVTFVGATKNGTSFLVNSLGLYLSLMGINTAILDMTQNRNAYYIYTDNMEDRRQIAQKSIEKLENGYAEGISVNRNKNLTVYTALPGDTNKFENAEPILSTLVQNHSVVLIDCDFNTPPAYFASCQEIYLVQSMDVLTIQPLTAFLRDLKNQGALEPEKVRVVINKEVKVKGLDTKMIVGGMARYNDPSMTVMKDLFNKDMVKACTIPFDLSVYSKYLEIIATCQVSLNAYPKAFREKLGSLAGLVYPMINNKKAYNPMDNSDGISSNNVFSSNMNNTLNKMKKKF